MTAYIDGKGRLSMPAEAEPQNLVRRGDELLDLATGELVSRPAWEIRSLDDLTFWMGLLHREQVEIEALKARIKNLQGMVAHHEAVKERLEARYTPSARSVVAEQVESGREKSVATEYGRTGWRRTRGSTVMYDEAAALAWAEEHARGAISRTVHVSLLPEHVEIPGVRRVEPEDRFYVTVKVQT